MSTAAKLLIALALLAAAGLAGWRAGAAHVRAEWTEARLDQETVDRAATDENRRIEQRRQSLVTEANHAATKREIALRAAADSARAELDGLRDELTAGRGDLPGAACEAVRKRAAALSDVFGECAAALESMAGKAGRHASDTLKFEQAWPVDNPLKGASDGQQNQTQ